MLTRFIVVSISQYIKISNHVVYLNVMLFKKKKLSKFWIEGNFFTLVQIMYQKLTANILFSVKTSDVFSIKLEIKQGCGL